MFWCNVISIQGTIANFKYYSKLSGAHRRSLAFPKINHQCKVGPRKALILTQFEWNASTFDGQQFARLL